MKKLSGSPQLPVAEFYGLDAGITLEFCYAVDFHLGVEPDGPNPGLNFRPSLYWVKNILRSYINRKGLVDGKHNVSRAPKDALKNLKKIEDLARKLSKELSGIDHDADDALDCALIPFRNDLKYLHNLTKGKIHDAVRMLALVAGVAQDDILKHVPEGTKKITHWPGYVDPDWHLVIDLARLYHSNIRNPELMPWDFARGGCSNEGNVEKLYSGPFFDFVQDCFEALGIADHSTNRALGDLILRALDRWEELNAQGISLSM